MSFVICCCDEKNIVFLKVAFLKGNVPIATVDYTAVSLFVMPCNFDIPDDCNLACLCMLHKQTLRKPGLALGHIFCSAWISRPRPSTQSSQCFHKLVLKVGGGIPDKSDSLPVFSSLSDSLT